MNYRLPSHNNRVVHVETLIFLNDWHPNAIELFQWKNNKIYPYIVYRKVNSHIIKHLKRCMYHYLYLLKSETQKKTKKMLFSDIRILLKKNSVTFWFEFCTHLWNIFPFIYPYFWKNSLSTHKFMKRINNVCGFLFFILIDTLKSNGKT